MGAIFADHFPDSFVGLTPARAIVQTMPSERSTDRLPQPQTAAESAAGVIVVNQWLPEGHVERYLQWIDSSTDFTTAFQKVAAVARRKPGLTIRFTAGRTYATRAVGGSTLFDMQGARDVSVIGNGALISAGNVSSGILDVFDLNGAQDIKIAGLRYSQTYQTLDPHNGARFFRIRNGSSRIRIENCEQLGGYSGITAIGDIATGGSRSDRITAIDNRFENVYYPQSFQGSGDEYFARGIQTINCGRGYFPYNVHDHDVEMVSQQGGPFDDVLLKVYADSRSAYNRLENIKLKYWSNGKHPKGVDTSSGNAIIAFDAQENTTTSTPAQFDNIDVQIVFDATPAPVAHDLVRFRKFTATSAVDRTARGHVFSNISVSALVRNWQNASGDCLDLFSPADGYSWNGDFARNFKVKDFFATGNDGEIAIRINDQPFSGADAISLENVFTNMRIDQSAWPKRKPLQAKNVTAAGLAARYFNKSYSPAWTASGVNPTIGNGTIVGRSVRSGNRIKGAIEITMGSTTTFGSGEYRFSLPARAASSKPAQIGVAYLLDWGSANYRAVTQIAAGANVASVHLNNDPATVGSNVPFTFGNGDRIVVEFDYVAAP